MASSRQPGPIGCEPPVVTLDDGTLPRTRAPRPGPIGLASEEASGQESPNVRGGIGDPGVARARRKPIQLPVLRQGARGRDVAILQRQLNARLRPSHNLKVDGVFGPITQGAVLAYQRGTGGRADGIVGQQTWWNLLRGERSRGPVSIASQAVGRTVPTVGGQAAHARPQLVAAPTASPTTTTSVAAWTLEEKFTDVLRRTGPKLPAGLRREFEALLTPLNIGITVATLVVWAGSHFFGVGEAVDIVLLLAGAFFLGMAAFDVADELHSFLSGTVRAANESDLDEAADHLARAISILGVAAFLALLAKVARRLGRGGAPKPPPKPPKPPPEPPPGPKPPQPKPPGPKPPTPHASPELNGAKSMKPSGAPDESRIRKLGTNHEQGGKVDLAQGKGAERYERATGRKVEPSTEIGSDFIDPDVGPVSLKGPVVDKRTGAPVSVKPEIIDGMGKSVAKDVRQNSATKRVVVDTEGMTPQQRQQLREVIDRELLKDPGGPTKDIVFLE